MWLFGLKENIINNKYQLLNFNNMKKSLLIGIIALLFIACGGNSQKKVSDSAKADPDVVNVYYFHGKQRCKTCIAVGDVAQKTIADSYAGNKKVKFTEVNTSEKENEALVEKYQVTWNALIIAKSDNSVDITEQAFANAVNNPQVLESMLKDEVNKRLN